MSGLSPSALAEVEARLNGQGEWSISTGEIRALLHAARECERLREDIEYHARQHEAYRRKCRHYEEAVCVQGIGPVRLHQDGAVTKEIDHRKLGALFHDANAAITLRADNARLRALLTDHDIDPDQPTQE